MKNIIHWINDNPNKIKIISVIILLFCFGAGYYFMATKDFNSNPKHYKKVYTDKKYSSHKEAISKVETTEKVKNSAEIINSLKNELTNIENEKDQDNFVLTSYPVWGESNEADFQTLTRVVKSGYKLDEGSIETFQETPDTVKIVFDMKKSGVSTISYTLKYGDTSKMFTIVNMYGNLDGFAA